MKAASRTTRPPDRASLGREILLLRLFGWVKIPLIGYVRPDQGAASGDGRAEVMSDHGGDGAIAQREDEPERVPNQVKERKGVQAVVVAGAPPGGSAVAPLVGSDHVETRRRKRQHDLAPAIGQFRESVKEQDAGPVSALEARLQAMQGEAVAVFDKA